MYGTIGVIRLVPEASAARAKLKSPNSGMRLANRLMDMLGMAAFPPDSEQNLTYLERTNVARGTLLDPRLEELLEVCGGKQAHWAVTTSLFPLALALLNRLLFRRLSLFFIRSFSNEGRPTAASRGKQRPRSLRGGLSVR